MTSSAISDRVSVTVLIMSFLTSCFFEVSCQTVDTYTSKNAESLPCIITEQTATVIWTEILVGNSVTVLTYQAGNTPTLSTEEKYSNFNYTLEPTSFDLIIMNVEDEDGGVYVCSPFGANPATYDVTVEVLAEPTIQNDLQELVQLDVIVGTSYDLTCSATGARSVSDLSLMWDPSLVVKSPLSITPNGDYKDYSITSTYTAMKGDSSITCQLTGYVMQDEINDQRMDNISHTVNLNVQYVPVCNMTIQEGKDCTDVTLTCECDAVPADITQYSFFDESSLINDGTSNTFTLRVAYETSTGFSCSATNLIGSGNQSDTNVHDCNKGTTVLPTTAVTDEPSWANTVTTALPHTTDIQSKAITLTTAQPSTTDPEASLDTTAEPSKTDPQSPECNYTGLIAACIVEAIIILVLVLVILYFITRDRLGHGGNRESRSTNQKEGVKETENKDYMDLRELDVDKNKKNNNVEVPENNLQLVSLLPGKGMLRYHKALLMRADGNMDVVVRTLSNDSTLQIIKLQSSEVQHILNLPGDKSIMQIFGWCNTVPNYLICEHLSGGNLSDILTEEFSPQKVHQYDNTKQKRFQVAEKGNAEHLPKYALQVARGIQFLTKHRFVSPGLRSKKVLLDAEGRCKLYDFVSMEKAKEWTGLLWNENVPFQWMPPEFLFLRQISSAGDIWSFGVLLWEIFSYGLEPYKEQTRADVEKSLRAEQKLPMPVNCSGAIWQVMITCWEQDAENRPKIDDVTSKLAEMYNEEKVYQEIQ